MRGGPTIRTSSVCSFALEHSMHPLLFPIFEVLHICAMVGILYSNMQNNYSIVRCRASQYSTVYGFVSARRNAVVQYLSKAIYSIVIDKVGNPFQQNYRTLQYSTVVLVSQAPQAKLHL